jgi:SOS-response transcriptional repressor LexA
MYQGYFYLIPAKLAEEGNPTKALLFGLLTSLASKNGFCYASNRFLAQKLGRKDLFTISKYLTELEKEGWIKREFVEGDVRKIYITAFLPTPLWEKTQTPLGKKPKIVI